MKRDEDMGPHHRGDEFQTDDEENQAQRVCEDDSETDSEDKKSPSRCHSRISTDSETQMWPQSYRVSMDMVSVTPPSISFLKGTNATGITSSFTYKRSQLSDSNSPLSRPFLPEHISDKEFPTSTLPADVSASRRSHSTCNEFSQGENKSSLVQATINGTNVLCGISLLTTPYALKESGWSGIILLSIIAIICYYTATLLRKCLESSPGLHTYPDIGQAAFGRPGRIATSILLYLELYAACVEFIIMMADNLSTVFPNTSMNFAGMHLDSNQTFSLISTLVVLPTVWLRDLSLLSYLSVGGLGASALLGLCLLWVGVVDKVGFHPTGTVLDLANLPVAVGIFGFGFSGHSVFPNIYTSMKDPSKFSSVLQTSFIFVWFLNAAVALCGYLMFGDSVKSQFTLNMPSELLASKIAVWTTVVTPMAKYALLITPVASSLEELVPSTQLNPYFVSLVVRTILVFSTLVVGLTLPFFGYLMALIGSLLAMIVAVILPCVFYLIILHEQVNKLQFNTLYSLVLYRLA
ncbi:hypothetical protein K2173_019491 [Erythroxylum novogranatense]|uniref:Amino acid transporter transmembrane domain-containing protein n=1 Tax=Erythroxylum novogranatense TaxID=1862640 RepID=A0AAV8UE78_9ROSI|nr:hypothetical protein K2173_019491 [Erythroxylum novogranatense]